MKNVQMDRLAANPHVKMLLRECERLAATETLHAMRKRLTRLGGMWVRLGDVLFVIDDAIAKAERMACADQPPT